ncbi:ISL3-like element ISPpu12 family transposase [soil metagenome]
MPEEAINATLGLEGLEVLGIARFEHLIEVIVESRFDAGSCHRCGGIAAEPKERPEVFVRDLSMSGRPVVLRWRKRRWRCTYCSKTWTESHPQVPPRARMTLRFKEHLATRAAAQGNFSKVALSERVSYDTVARAHKERADLVRKLRPRLAPKVISIDEASVRRGFNYNTVVTDVLARYVIGTIPGRRQDALVRWFADLDEEVREGIEVVIMDMARFYRASINRILPHAVVVVDKFHVIRAANYALDRVRGRLQGRKPRSTGGWPRRLFRCRFALLRSTDNLRDQDRSSLTAVFDVFPEMGQAQRLKEGLREVFESADRTEAALALEIWFQHVKRADLPEFNSLAKMIGWWREELLNHFTYRMTNAYAEGITNRIKVIKRQAYGVPNIANFEDRILVQCGMPKDQRIPA